MKLSAFLRNFSTLQRMLGVSVALHAALLSVRFIDPEGFHRVFQDTPLEVILVNAKSNERPDKAQAIAQANMAGGGEADKGRATSPLPYSALTAVGDDFEESQRRLDAMQEQQNQLLAQLRKRLATLPEPDTRQTSQSDSQSAEEEKRRQLVKLLAEIEKRINEENARPKKRYISPATREEAYAVYYSGLRSKVEDKGTENFPEQGGRKLYGELTMIVTVNHDGRVLDTEVVQGSGNSALDRQAQAIARAAGPFGHFNAEMRRQADQIAMVARFKFTRDQTLQTNSEANPESRNP
jgi:protein TonB